MDRQHQVDNATFRHVSQQQQHHDEDDHDEHSPESAGLARGLARSAASRSAVGRLPVSSARAGGKSMVKTTARQSMRVRSPRATMHKPTTSMANQIKMRGGGARVSAASKVKIQPSGGKVAGAAKRATPRGAGGRGVNVRRIARASDRASTGLDLVEAASSEEASAKSEVPRQDFSGRIKDVMRRVPAFMTTLAKNTVLGMAVFATYESVVEYELPSSSVNDGNGNIISPDPFAAATLSRHITAGVLAGAAHAGVNYTMDGMVRMRHNSFGGVAKGTAPAPSPFLPYTMHHAISHGVLFGSYEGTKRVLISFLGGGIGENTHHKANHDDDENMHYSNLLAIGLAGGIAGTLQHVVSEYTETTFVSSYSQIWQKDWTFSERLQLLPRASLPSPRALAMAFIPSSIGFVAFEYGKELMHVPSHDVGRE